MNIYTDPNQDKKDRRGMRLMRILMWGMVLAFTLVIAAIIYLGNTKGFK